MKPEELRSLMEKLDLLDGKVDASSGMMRSMAEAVAELEKYTGQLSGRIDDLDDRLKVAIAGAVVTNETDVDMDETESPETLIPFYPDMVGGRPWEMSEPMYTNDILLSAAPLMETFRPELQHQMPLYFITADHATNYEMIMQISKNSFFARMSALMGVKVGPGSFAQFRWFDLRDPQHRGILVPHAYCGVEMLHFKGPHATGFHPWATKVDGLIDFELHTEHRVHEFWWGDFHDFQKAWIDRQKDATTAIGPGVGFSPS